MRRMTICSMIGAAALAMSHGIACAGDQNRIVIEQDNTLGLGNSLTADQSQATGSLIGGATANGDNTLSLSQTARQIGGGNTADLMISDSAGHIGGQIGLTQDNSSPLASTLGNSAVISVLGNGTGLVSQIGGGNTANLKVTGLGASGSIYQNGNNNHAGDASNTGLLVSGSGASGAITQNGNNNSIGGLDVKGAGTTASYILNGSNVTVAAGLPVSVISNGASVTITQSTLP